MLHNRRYGLQLLRLLVADPFRKKFVMFADHIVFFDLRNPSWHLTCHNGRTEFLTHVKAVVFFEIFIVPEKIIIVSRKLWLWIEDIFVKIASLHASNAECTASESEYFVFVELLQWL